MCYHEVQSLADRVAKARSRFTGISPIVKITLGVVIIAAVAIAVGYFYGVNNLE